MIAMLKLKWIQEELMNRMPNPKAMFDEIVDIQVNPSIEDSANIVQDVVKHFVEKEAITFEDIWVKCTKVTMVRLCLMCLTKMVIPVKKFGDAKAAMEYLHKNFDELRY